MTGEEIQREIIRLNIKIAKLKARQENYAKHISKEITKVCAELVNIEDQCKHEDTGGPFMAVCKWCGHCEY